MNDDGLLARLPHLAGETLRITLLVAVMMVAVDLLNVLTKDRLHRFFERAGRSRQYVVASLIGTVPGCIGGFTNVSLYIHGMISFGALAGSLIAVSGDEAFVMLAMFPRDAVLLFGLLFVFGIAGGWLIDRVSARLNLRTCSNCGEMGYHQPERSVRHYLVDHVYRHIIRRHLLRTAVWTFAALAAVDAAMTVLPLERFASEYRSMFLLLAVVTGLIPESGPHLFFVTLYAQGFVPFSVLLTSAIVQDGHGMLPMLSFSVADAVKVKAFNAVLGLLAGSLVFAAGW